MSWHPLSKRRRRVTEERATRALVPLLSGPEAASYANAIFDELELGEKRDVYRVVRHHLPEEVPDVVAGVVVAVYLSAVVDDASEQRESDELLSDAGVPSELLSAVIEEVRELQKGRAA